MVHAEHIVHHQHLPIGVFACADADGGAGNALGDGFAQRGGHAFHQYHACACCVVRLGICQHGGSGIATPLHFVAAKHVDILRRKPDVGADGDGALLQELRGLGEHRAAFQFHHVRACCHQRSGGGKGLFFALLVAAKGQVGKDKAVAVAAGNVLGVVNHVFQRYGQGAALPLHGHAQRVANQQDFYARAVHQGGERGFVAGKHGDFFAVGFHFFECV